MRKMCCILYSNDTRQNVGLVGSSNIKGKKDKMGEEIQILESK